MNSDFLIFFFYDSTGGEFFEYANLARPFTVFFSFFVGEVNQGGK